MSTSMFLEALHGNASVNFRAINKMGAKNITGTYEHKKTELTNLNNEGYNIYFVVNGGGTRSHEINKINAFFVDFDCGKDNEGHYFSLEITAKYKEECLRKIDSYIFEPSFIIETRNGLHVYWLVNNGASIEQFKLGQLRLISYFNSDTAITTPERLMRVPDFYWMKDIDNPFMCRLLKESTIRYSAEDIINSLPSCTKEKGLKSYKTRSTQISNHTCDNIDLIKNKDIEGLRKAIFYDNIKGEKVPTIEKDNIDYSIVGTFREDRLMLSSREELYNTIKQQDLTEFLGISRNPFNCIFHEDNNPSASISINDDNGHFLYNCHSSNCEFNSGSIIEVVERLQGCSTSQAINFIKAVYNVDVEETPWQKYQKKLLDENISCLLSGRIEQEYPVLYKRVKNYIHILVNFIELSKDYVYDEPLKGTEEFMFYCSTRYIAEKIGSKDYKGVNSKLNLFAFLGLIKKLDYEKLPSEIADSSRQHALNKRYNNNISYYAIPKYTKECLDEAENFAKLLKDNNMTMRGWSREYLVRTFDESVANRVFTQSKGKQISSNSREFESKFDLIVINLIQQQGYATEKQILEILKGSKEMNLKRIKIMLQETLDKYNYRRVRANNEIKSKYSIESRGNPCIIIKNDL